MMEKISLGEPSNTRGTSLSCSICSEHLRSHRSHTKCSGASQLPLGSGEEIASLKNEFIEKFTEMHLCSSVKECLSFASKEQNTWGYRLLHFVAFSTKKNPKPPCSDQIYLALVEAGDTQEGWELPLHIPWRGVL